MKKKVAILVDAEWFRKMLKGAFAPRAVPSSAAPVTPPAPSAPTAPATPVVAITADLFYRNACAALDPLEEDLFRFFCYDCEPFDKQQRNPVDQSWVKFGKGNPVYEDRMKFFREIGALPYVALRRGVVKGRGWEIKESFTSQLLSAPHGTVTLAAGDIRYGMEQKGVDMRIGMDFATLSLKRLVDRIILISGDTDMVPAIKLARREGIQVCMVQVGTQGRLAPTLIEDADLVRTITPTA
ncbi:MAG: NYN domain-containing protein [Verrucomicrobia bacterium]|nr:NYN domain-containing protein [Verrucomicrobiota bacterium]